MNNITVLPKYFTILTDQAPQFEVTARPGFNLEQHLTDLGIDFVKVHGVYSGTSELSYLIPHKAYMVSYKTHQAAYRDRQAQCEQLASLLGQAAVLHWEQGERGVLVFTNGINKHKWLISKHASMSETKPSGDYTQIGKLFLQVDF